MSIARFARRLSRSRSRKCPDPDDSLRCHSRFRAKCAPMRRPVSTTSRVLTGAAVLLALTAAVRPAALAEAAPGLWEISRSDGGRRNMCVADPSVLAQYEHMRGKCTRDLIRDQGRKAEISYSCSGGGFGQSTIEEITPRSLRVETQGISNGAPFHYVLQARRIGNC